MTFSLNVIFMLLTFPASGRRIYILQYVKLTNISVIALFALRVRKKNCLIVHLPATKKTGSNIEAPKTVIMASNFIKLHLILPYILITRFDCNVLSLSKEIRFCFVHFFAPGRARLIVRTDLVFLL